MDCAHIRERLESYLDNELPEEASKEVTSHVDLCAGCAAELRELSRLRGFVHAHYEGVAEAAERDGLFDGFWESVESQLELPAEPEPGIWTQLAATVEAWWRRHSNVLVPALAAAGVLAIMVGLTISRSEGPNDEGAVLEPNSVARGASDELPPFAGPRLMADKGAPKGVAEADRPAVRKDPLPHRRAPEGMVAKNDTRIVYYEVDCGIVLIDNDPRDPDRPTIVWHFLPDDEEGDEKAEAI